MSYKGMTVFKVITNKHIDMIRFLNPSLKLLLSLYLMAWPSSSFVAATAQAYKTLWATTIFPGRFQSDVTENALLK